MLKRLIFSLALSGMVQNVSYSQEVQVEHIPSVEDLFSNSKEQSVVTPVLFNELNNPPPIAVEPGSPPSFACDANSCAPGIGGCDSYGCEQQGWLSSICSDEPLLAGLKNQKIGDWTYSIGGSLRYRFLEESNRLRPPVPAGRSSYNQWRITPYLEVKHGDQFTGYVQAIDAPTFNADLPELPIDENRFDLLQYYGDMKLLGSGDTALRLRTGRQFLKYGSQHLISPLGWSNTFRNFEGAKLYYTSPDWNIDAFATRPVNGATGNTYRPTSFDNPDQSRWFSGVYATYKQAPKGTLDLYWLWLDEDADRADRIDGNRHTFGARYAGKHPIKDECGCDWLTFGWDWEGAFQVGEDVVGAGPAQDVTAGFISSNSGLTFHQLPWTPTLSGVFFWGSGDDDPTDGDNHTVSTLFPLGHAYWGLIDNFNGQNLIDYSTQITVKPTKKLTLLTAVHWFKKAEAEDAIWNVAGAPFGGVTTTASRNLGTEVDLVATYAVNKNLKLQTGYFWFFYGDAVDGHPNAAVANRNDADQFYFFADWSF